MGVGSLTVVGGAAPLDPFYPAYYTGCIADKAGKKGVMTIGAVWVSWILISYQWMERGGDIIGCG